MKATTLLTKVLVTSLLLVTITTGASASCKKQYSKEMQSKIDSLQKILKTYEAGTATLEKNLITFDTLDYTLFSNQEWVRMHESHDKDIKVNWPDGHSTVGLDRHIEDMKAMFVYAPDTRVKLHPVRFGSANGEWTSVIGVFEGTFTKPMPIGNGKFIQPNGKAFKLPMCTVGHWKNGVMIEEYLFWDNATYAAQLGLK